MSINFPDDEPSQDDDGVVWDQSQHKYVYRDDFEIPAGYHSEPAPCGTEIWGTPYDIDSGLRRHIDGCETCQEIRSRD